MRTLLLLLPPAVALAVVLVACGGGGVTPTAPVPPFGLDTRPVLAPLSFPTGLPQPGAFKIERAFGNLTFARPVLLTAATDGSDWVYVVEQAGRILVFQNDDTVSTPHTFLDLRGMVSRAGSEEGLLGLAFDPDFGNGNGTFWIHYSVANPRRGRIERYEATFPGGGLPPVANLASAKTILEVSQPYSNHNGGMIAFGPDDMLYVGLGDGGSANDPQENGQDPSTLLAAILRLDVRGQDTYSIPPDNPFDEVWAYGLRNPWRFSFDRRTGDLWYGDVGQGDREEVGIARRGENHGWPVYEGFRSNLNPGGIPPSAFAQPVLDYARGDGTCVIGGIVHRGAYVYGDYGSGRVWALVYDGSRVISNEQVAVVSSVASFGEDADGELYAISLGGTLWRFVETDGGEPPAFPQTLSATGLFSDTAALVPNPGLIEFDVNAPLWSDGTTKRRWIALPNGARIGFRSTGAWDLPPGTVLVKHFEIRGRRLETRALVLEEAGWRGYTWRWREDQADADLLPGAATETLTVDGREQVYDYPSRTDCLRCHTEAAGFVLGPRTRQLNRDFAFANATDNQLRTWNHLGLFDRDIGEAASYDAFPDPYEDARAWLDANCAFCHRPGGPAPSDVDLRFDTPLANTHLVDEPPTEGDVGLADPRRVRPGDHASSVLWERVRRRGDGQMPPLATNVVDQPAVDLLRAWIDALE